MKRGVLKQSILAVPELNVSESAIPKHIAIIMDGNGRWAKLRGVNKISGHKKGAETAKKIILNASKIGVKYLTLYAFSSENWNRPEEEVSKLMALLKYYISTEKASLSKNNIKIRIIGDLTMVSETMRAEVLDAENKTKNNTGMNLTIAFSYGSRQEILQAAVSMAEDYKCGKIDKEDINMDRFSSYLYTHDIPDPDLLIRTSGEKRISNFLLWQIAYSELYFTDTKWPDFTEEHFQKAIIEFQTRERRYGK